MMTAWLANRSNSTTGKRAADRRPSIHGICWLRAAYRKAIKVADIWRGQMFQTIEMEHDVSNKKNGINGKNWKNEELHL